MLMPYEESKSRPSRGGSMAAAHRGGRAVARVQDSYSLAHPTDMFNSLMKEHQHTMKEFDSMSKDLMGFGFGSKEYI